MSFAIGFVYVRYLPMDEMFLLYTFSFKERNPASMLDFFDRVVTLIHA